MRLTLLFLSASTYHTLFSSRHPIHCIQTSRSMSSGNPNKRSATPQNAGNGSHDRKHMPFKTLKILISGKKQRVPGVSEYQPQKPSLQLFAPTFQIPACHQAVLNESIGRIAAVLTDEYNGRLDAENRELFSHRNSNFC